MPFRMLRCLALACVGAALATPMAPGKLAASAEELAAAGGAAHARLAAQPGSCFSDLLLDLAEGGTCAAVVEATDPALTQALRARVALSLTRCHYAASLRAASDCMESGSDQNPTCLSIVTDAEFGIYTAFLNEVTSLCFHIAQAHWRGQVNDLVASLLSHATAARAELERSNAGQALLLDAQNQSLSMQEDLLAGLSDAEARMDSHTSALDSIIQHAETSLGIQAFLASHLLFLQTVGWYISAALGALLLTSDPRTASARLPVMVLLVLGAVAEWRLAYHWTAALSSGGAPAAFKLGKWHVTTSLPAARDSLPGGAPPPAVLGFMYTAHWSLEEACWALRTTVGCVAAAVIGWVWFTFIDHAAATATALATMDARMGGLSALMASSTSKPVLSAPHTPPRISRLPDTPPAGPTPGTPADRDYGASPAYDPLVDSDEEVAGLLGRRPWMAASPQDTSDSESEEEQREGSPIAARVRRRSRVAGLAAANATVAKEGPGHSEPVAAFLTSIAHRLLSTAEDFAHRQAVLSEHLEAVAKEEGGEESGGENDAPRARSAGRRRRPTAL